jgi:hypothetical protein
MVAHPGDMLDRLAEAHWLTLALWMAGVAWTVAGLQSVFSTRKRSRIFGTAPRGSVLGKLPAYLTLAGGCATLVVLARPYLSDLLNGRPYLVDVLPQWSEFL